MSPVEVVIWSMATGAIGTVVLFGLAELAVSPRKAAGLQGTLYHALALLFVFLLSGLDANAVEDLSIMPLERPEQARRLVAGEGSVTFVNRAELTHADILPD